MIGIIELTVALALKQCQVAGAGDYLGATHRTLTRLVTAIGDADMAAATASAGEAIDLDEAQVMALLP
ncbi:hypothetical protein D9M68_828590 [compost metagenome]